MGREERRKQARLQKRSKGQHERQEARVEKKPVAYREQLLEQSARLVDEHAAQAVAIGNVPGEFAVFVLELSDPWGGKIADGIAMAQTGAPFDRRGKPPPGEIPVAVFGADLETVWMVLDECGYTQAAAYVRGPRPTGVPLGGVLVAVLGGGAASIFWHVPGGMRVVGEG